eukprot:scaffold73008_cov33-Phaeocystis_antarctica.AAC.1
MRYAHVWTCIPPTSKLQDLESLVGSHAVDDAPAFAYRLRFAADRAKQACCRAADDGQERVAPLHGGTGSP